MRENTLLWTDLFDGGHYTVKDESSYINIKHQTSLFDIGHYSITPLVIRRLGVLILFVTLQPYSARYCLLLACRSHDFIMYLACYERKHPYKYFTLKRKRWRDDSLLSRVNPTSWDKFFFSFIFFPFQNFNSNSNHPLFLSINYHLKSKCVGFFN